MKPLPLSIPLGDKPTITQEFGDTSNATWYMENGLFLTAHNGTDIVVGDSVLTYGTKIVCPVPSAQLSQVWWSNPMSTSGNGIQIAWEEDGDRYNMRAWHCSKVEAKPFYSLGETIGYIGNSGLCKPAPSLIHPYDGSHLHLMMYKNGEIIDPLTIFDRTKWFIGEDSGVEYDVEPIKWAINKLGLNGIMEKIKYVLSVIFLK